MSRPLRDICRRCFLHVTSVTTFLLSGFIPPRSPEVFPMYAFLSHLEESFWGYLCCSSCSWDSCRICPSAQAGASYSLPEISLCHQMYSAGFRVGCDTVNVMFFQNGVLNTAEHCVHSVTHKPLWENSNKNRLWAADFLIVLFTLILCEQTVWLYLTYLKEESSKLRGLNWIVSYQTGQLSGNVA